MSSFVALCESQHVPRKITPGVLQVFNIITDCVLNAHRVFLRMYHTYMTSKPISSIKKTTVVVLRMESNQSRNQVRLQAFGFSWPGVWLVGELAQIPHYPE